MTELTRAEMRPAGEELDAAMAASRARFGTSPLVFGFHPNTWPQLAVLFREAVAEGVPLTIADTYIRMGRVLPNRSCDPEYRHRTAIVAGHQQQRLMGWAVPRTHEPDVLGLDVARVAVHIELGIIWIMEWAHIHLYFQIPSIS